MSTTSYTPAAPPEGVLFDLDGTLADTAPDLGDAVNRLLIEEGRPPLPLGMLRPHTSSGVRGMLRVAFDLRPDDRDYEPLASRFLAHYERNLCVKTTLFEGMAELLSTLERHQIKWGIVTNKRMRYTAPLVEQLGLRSRAASVVSGDSTMHPKPAPDPLLLACREARIRPERSVYVGDDLRDIQAGRAAGMKTVAAAYGYLGTDAPLESWDADMTIDQPLTLLSVLQLRAP